MLNQPFFPQRTFHFSTVSPLSNPEELSWLDSVSQAFRSYRQTDDFHPDWLHSDLALPPRSHDFLTSEGGDSLLTSDLGLGVTGFVPAPFSNLYTWLGDAVTWTCDVIRIGDAPVKLTEQRSNIEERPRLARIDSRRSLNEVNLDGQPFISSRSNSLTDLSQAGEEGVVAGLVYEVYGAWR